MNLDHLFLQLSYLRNEPVGLAAVRTNRKGAVIDTFAEAVARNKSEPYGDMRNVVRNMEDALMNGRSAFVAVVYDREEFSLDTKRSMFSRMVDMIDVKAMASADVRKAMWMMVCHISTFSL